MAEQVLRGKEDLVTYRRRQAKKIVEAIEQHRVQAEKEKQNFTAADEEQLLSKLSGSRSPMIVFQGSTGSVAPGGTVNYTVGINNPDPFSQIWLYVYLFIGPGNMVRDVAAALATGDPRFPNCTQPSFPGLTIASGDTESLRFSIPVPAGIKKSNYLINSFLFQSNWHDVGEYFDRGVISFEVT